jgi:hypothetical protein
MNIYKELFQNWIPDCPTESPKQEVIIYEAGQQPGSDDGFLKILWDFYSSFHTDYGPVFTIASFLLIYVGTLMILSMVLWRKWGQWASTATQWACALLLAYIVMALIMSNSSVPLMANNGQGMLSRLFISMFIHIPIFLVLMVLVRVIVPLEPEYRTDALTLKLRNMQMEHDYLNRNKR